MQSLRKYPQRPENARKGRFNTGLTPPRAPAVPLRTFHPGWKSPKMLKSFSSERPQSAVTDGIDGPSSRSVSVALVGILTAIEAIKGIDQLELSNMAPIRLPSRTAGMHIRIGNAGKRPKRFRAIIVKPRVSCTRRIFRRIGDHFGDGIPGASTVKFGDKKRTPHPGDGRERNLSADQRLHHRIRAEFLSAGSNSANVAIIGNDLVEKIFPSSDPARQR